MANKMQRYEVQMKLFEPEAKLPVLQEVPIRSKAGFQYIYKWESTAKRKDWRADGYRWRQNATVKFNYNQAKCKRYYFKLKIGPGNDYSSEFSKHAIECSLYEKQILVWYQGDDSVVVDFSHGNSKDPEKEFHRTAPSVLSQMKSVKEKLPVQVFTELVLAAPRDLERHITDAPRNMQQIRNAQKSARRAERLSLDAVCNLVELRNETGFMSDIHLAPGVLVICFKDRTMEEFKHLVARDDLSAQFLTYDTTYEMGEYNLSVLTFRQTEFEEAPAIPLMFMLHEQKVESVHNFFFMRLDELVPELKTTEVMLIVSSEEEEAIANVIKKNCPNISLLRSWQLALQDIKKNLDLLGITDQDEVKEYESDFVRLLNQNSGGDYKAILAQMYLKKWKKDFSNYFDENIDPEMSKMGAWALRPFGLSLDSLDFKTDSFNSLMKKFDGFQNYPIDMLAISLLRIDEFYADSVTRGRNGLDGYTLREHLTGAYQDDIVPDSISADQLLKNIESEMKSRKNMRMRAGRQNGTKRPAGVLDADSKEEMEKRRQISEAVDSLTVVVQELLEDEA